ncbi:MAG: hypothetical protein WC346_21870 [Methanogenium sp.]|jgi:hypothetical protein
MKKNKLSFDQTSDLEKEVEGEVREDTSLEKEADLYYKTLFTAVPNTHDISLGIYPEDQQLSSRKVLLWNSLKQVPPFLEDYKILKVKLSHKIIAFSLKNIGGGIYTLEFIPNTLPMEEQDFIAFREE